MPPVVHNEQADPILPVLRSQSELNAWRMGIFEPRCRNRAVKPLRSEIKPPQSRVHDRPTERSGMYFAKDKFHFIANPEVVS